MAFVSLKSCVAEGELAQAILDVQQNLGDIKSELDALLGQIAVDAAMLVQGNDILDRETQQAPNPMGDFTEAAGLPAISPSAINDEERLELLGLILINGIVYLQGGDQNIENFRRLYFSLGSDHNRFMSVIDSSEPFVVIQTYLKVQKLPEKQQGWTLQEVQDLFSNPAIESVYVAGDGISYCIIPQFLSLNKSLVQTSQENNIDPLQISTQVFWLKTIEINSSTINRMKDLGLTENQTTAVLSGMRMIDARPSALFDAETSFTTQTDKALSQINLLNSRWSKTTPQVIDQFRVDIYKSIKSAEQFGFELQNIVRFWPTLIEEPDQIKKFLELNSLSDLHYLFSTRRSVHSINFSATYEEVMAAISQVLNIPAGSTTLSALQSNQIPLTLDSHIDEANVRLVQNACGLNIMSRPFKYSELQTAYGCLSQSLDVPALPDAREIPLTGYEAYDSPCTILFRRADVFMTLGLDKKLRELEDSVSEEAQPIREVVEATAQLLRDSRKIIDNTFNDVRQKMNQYTADIESFMSRYMALQGTASIDASILRCAFGYDLSADLPILQELANYIRDAEKFMRNQLSRFASFLSTLLNKLLCYPVNLANGFLGGLENNIPSFCQAYKVRLPEDIERTMLEIRNQFQFTQTLTQSYRRDMFRVQATLQGSPGRLDFFRESLVCESNANSRFFKKSQQLVMGKFTIPNPISRLPIIGGG